MKKKKSQSLGRLSTKAFPAASLSLSLPPAALDRPDLRVLVRRHQGLVRRRNGLEPRPRRRPLRLALAGLLVRVPHPGEGAVGGRAVGLGRADGDAQGLIIPGVAEVVHPAGRPAGLLFLVLRGRALAVVFQDPMTSLNPVLTVGFQVAEALCYHRDMDRREASAAALDLLEQVKIPSARQRFADYPHQFSGGMRQRVMIAMALACRPELLLADEPTTALDVTIQAQVLSLLAELKATYGMAMIFITHNLGVVASIADRVAAMYAGEIVEIAPVNQLFARPAHPYTELLLRSIPRVDRDTGNLSVIAGQVPALGAMPTGCRFAPRCPLREAVCTLRDPPLVALADAPDHHVRCWLRAPPVGGGHD